MSIINNLIDIFLNNIDYNLIKYEETFHEVNLQITSNDLIIPCADEFDKVINAYPKRDNITITISIDTMPSSYFRGMDSHDFINEVEDNYNVRDSDSEFEIKIRINKNIDSLNRLTIYRIQLLTDYLNKLTMKGVLYSFSNLLNGHSYIIFDLLDSNETFYTYSFYFVAHKEIDNFRILSINRDEIKNKRDSISNFLDVSNYNFIPEDFCLKLKSSTMKDFNRIMNKICGILSIISISNISSISSDNDINIVLNGYKTIKGNLNYKEIEDSELNQYIEIYEWVYGDGNISDKVGLARNIVSLYINDNNFLSLEAGTIASIISSYEIYLKENVYQYIETKNKVTEYLFDMSKKSGDIVDNFSNMLKNNLYGFFTFFISVIILNSLSGNTMTNIFTKDITIISFSLLAISTVFLIAACYEINKEKERFIYNYKEFKKSYTDILDPKDIERIFNFDENLKRDLSYINTKIKIYRNAWIVTITIFFIAIVVLKYGNSLLNLIKSIKLYLNK